MSVTDLRGAAAYGDEPSGDDFDAIFGGSAGGRDGRTPPQDHAAEQSVLGAMLLSKDAIADVVESIRGSDFYRPAHELLYDAIIDLYGRGEPADAVTVGAQLTRRGELGKVGGAPYLHTLVASVPIATNASYYADIVREKAILRRLVDAGTKIAQLGFSGEGQVDDVVDRAQAEIYSVTDKRTSEDYAPLSEILAATLDEIEAISAHDGGLAGVPTGFADLDDLTNGLHPGQMVIVAARPALGKALALDTALATPTGWTTMGQVGVGDLLMGADGRPTTVTAATPVMSERPCYRVTFSDGSRIVADAEHQWLTTTGGTRTSVRTTQQLATALREPDVHRHRAMHAVPNTKPLELAEALLPIRPYTLGVWLCDAHPDSARRATTDPEITMYVEADGDEGAEAEQLQAQLRSIGVLGSNRHIPAAYLRAAQRQRRALLSGLLDAAATVTSTGDVEFAASDQRLIADVHELAVGLGHRCRHSTKRVTGRRATASVWHVLTITPVDDVFRLSHKATEQKERRRGSGSRVARRYITRVEAIPSEPVRCVEVDNADHLYLAGHSMIPTHNSTLGLDLCRAASIKHGMASVIFSLEMSRTEITMRLLSAEARIAINHMRNGNMNDDDWARLARKMGEVSEAPLFIDDSPNMTMMEIRAKARRLKQRHDLRLIVVDYLQLMTSGRKVESRQLEVSEFSRQMKLLAKELEIPIVAISQLNRGAEQRTDKRPFLSDLRESGSLEQDADLVILLHREDAYERESTRPGEADLIVAKHRSGPTDTIVVAFQGHYSRFVDMQQT